MLLLLSLVVLMYKLFIRTKANISFPPQRDKTCLPRRQGKTIGFSLKRKNSLMGYPFNLLELLMTVVCHKKKEGPLCPSLLFYLFILLMFYPISIFTPGRGWNDLRNSIQRPSLFSASDKPSSSSIWTVPIIIYLYRQCITHFGMRMANRYPYPRQFPK